MSEIFQKSSIKPGEYYSERQIDNCKINVLQMLIHFMYISNKCYFFMIPDIVGPLNFSLDNSVVSIPEMLFPKAREISCLLCDLIFKLNTEKHSFLKHLFTKHRFIIGDEDQIELFHEYVMHWREIFEGDESKISEFCTIIIMDQLPDGTEEKNVPYYLLCDVSTTDYEIRHKLRSKQIDLVLAMHKFERSDEKFEKNCLFCRDVIKSTRHFYIRHLYTKHFLQLGKPGRSQIWQRSL